MCLLDKKRNTVKTETVTGVDFGIDTQHVGQIRMFDEPSVQDLLTEVVKLVWIDSSLDSDSIVSLFSDNSVQHFSEPPNT